MINPIGGVGGVGGVPASWRGTMIARPGGGANPNDGEGEGQEEEEEVAVDRNGAAAGGLVRKPRR